MGVEIRGKFFFAGDMNNILISLLFLKSFIRIEGFFNESSIAQNNVCVVQRSGFENV